MNLHDLIKLIKSHVIRGVGMKKKRSFEIPEKKNVKIKSKHEFVENHTWFSFVARLQKISIMITTHLEPNIWRSKGPNYRRRTKETTFEFRLNLAVEKR